MGAGRWKKTSIEQGAANHLARTASERGRLARLCRVRGRREPQELTGESLEWYIY